MLRARAFLNPESVPSTAFPGIARIVEPLQDAVRSQDPVCVWGDFDVDGQTSTALLVQALRLLGASVTYHVPLRSTEGHGINVSNLERILKGGARVVLTCDTGITANGAVFLARERGAQVLVTDHHDPDEVWPEANGIMNPKSLPPSHALADLAGVGVSFKLAEALLAENGLDPEALLDLVALGLIADVAVLREETRVPGTPGHPDLAEGQQTRHSPTG